MNYQNSHLEILEKCEKQLTNIYNYSDIIGLYKLEELKQKIKNLSKDAENAKDTNRLLRIGIIGQIKRGKSSFLNALLFEGDNILPNAVTPMTAALTAIKYSDQSKAVIEFYTQDDWQAITENAEKYKSYIRENPNSHVPAEFKSCNELIDNVKGLEIQKYLGTTREISQKSSINELVTELKNYIGVGGTYTSLVKYSELFLNHELLKDIEIVDTPGLNDPITSRTAKTKDFMGRCDVIFLLSASHNFLPIQDMILLRQNIPSKGIHNIALIGSRFDDSLLDEGEEYNDVESAIEELKRKYTKKAEKNINGVKNELGGANLKTIESLEDSLPPIFISSMFYNIAKHYDSLNAEERNYLVLYNGLYPGYNFSAELLLKYSNITEANEKLQVVKAKKKEILMQRLSALLNGFVQDYKMCMQDTLNETKNRFNKLLTSDIKEITQSYNELIKRIKNGKTKVENVFQLNIADINTNFAELKLEIKSEGLRAKKINTQTHSETYSYEVSTAKLWNPFSWFSTETRYKTITYSYANIHEAIELLEDFVLLSEKSLIRAIKEIVNLSKIRNDVLISIKDLFDFEDDSFDPRDILGPLEVAVKKITVPEISLNVEKRIETVRNKFSSSRVKDDEIESLRNEQARVVSMIIQDIYEEINTINKNICSKLEDAMNTFLPQLIEDLQETAEILKQQLKDKEKNKKQYEDAIKLLETSLQEM